MFLLNKKNLITIVLVSLSLFLLMGFVAINSSQIITLDESSYQFSKNLADSNPLWLQINHVISLFGSWNLLCLFGVLVATGYALKKKWAEVLLIALLMPATLTANSQLKLYFNRPRPASFNNLDTLTNYSFPSGHAMGSTFFYLFLFWLLSQNKNPARFALLAFPLLIGASRVFLGVHWFSDVIAGYFLGFFWLATTLLVSKQFKLFSK